MQKKISNNLDNNSRIDYNLSICIEVFGIVTAMDEVLPILRALADPTRLAVFQCIRECGGSACYDTCTGLCDGGCAGGMAVCDVRCQVPCAPSTLTHHLNTLRDAGLIETRKRGREVYAAIRPEALMKIIAFCSLETK